jgi:hypothetical protein
MSQPSMSQPRPRLAAYGRAALRLAKEDRELVPAPPPEELVRNKPRPSTAPAGTPTADRPDGAAGEVRIAPGDGH